MKNLGWLKIAALVVVIGFIIWFGSHLRFTETAVPLPLKGEAVTNPYYAAIKLSEALRARASWERIFTLPATDSVVLLSNWNWSLSRGRRALLEKWVADGGRLVVDNSLIGGAEEFETWSGITQVDHSEDFDAQDDGTADEAGTGSDEPSGDDAPRKRTVKAREPSLVQQLIDEDCTTLTEDGTQRALRVCDLDSTVSLKSAKPTTWALRADDRIEALRVAVGRGSVTVLNAAPFRYRDFLQGDHAQLFVAASQLHHGDNVVFFTEEDHASLLALTWRYGAAVVLLLAALIALALWRNTSRFGPLAAPAERARRSLGEQIRGTGQFTLRFGGGRALHTATVRALREAAIRRLPAYDRMSTEDRVAALSKLTGVLSSELGPALNYTGTRSPHELRNAIAVIETARRRLTTKKARG